MRNYVIGHKNPDTDAICSAIAYADLLQKTTMPEMIAARCGEFSPRTAYVLERAGIDHPHLVMDVRPNAANICRRSVITCNTGDSILDAYERMKTLSTRSIPVLNDEGHTVGMLSLLKLVEQLLPTSESVEQARIVETSLARLSRTLKGEFQNAVDIDREEELILTVGALSAELFKKRLHDYDPKNLLIVAGDRPTVQLPSIEYGVRAIIITGHNYMSPELLAKAKDRGVSILISPRDTATTTVLIKCSQRIVHAIRTEFMSFSPHALVRTIKEQVQETSQALFPVLTEEGTLFGVFAKSDLINPQAARLVLVDHNELAQAVTGADEADIIEVIDHHRIGGGLTSKEPIHFINEPVGSTSTIVASMFQRNNIQPSRAIAICMAGGIISDTLYLTSPTSTPTDRKILEWLEKITECDMEKFAHDFFSAGSVLQASTAAAAVRADCKEYSEAGWKIGVAQVEEQSLQHFWDRKDELHQALIELNSEKRLDFSCLLITDITRHYSLLIVEGDERLIQAIDYPKLQENLFELEGIVSRKKQLLPRLMFILHKVAKT